MTRYVFATLLLWMNQIFAGGGVIVNPISDICWECLFPITVSGTKVTPGYKDFDHHSSVICFCPGTPPKVGIPVTFWEPTKLVDITKEAYKLVGLGGMPMSKATTKNRGSVSKSATGSSKSFSHLHIYDYPVFTILELFTDFSCVENGSWDLAYFSELDYTWYDDSLNNIINPEGALFANPLAQTVCIADCTSSTLKKPQNALFWCAGCQGSLYPLTGTVSDHVGDIQASLLLLQRGLAKMHKGGTLKSYQKENYCETSYTPIIKKASYKTQMVYPVANTKNGCQALGESDVIWGAGKSYPVKGEEFVYILWSKKQCCLDVEKAAAMEGVF